MASVRKSTAGLHWVRSLSQRGANTTGSSLFDRSVTSVVAVHVREVAVAFLRVALVPSRGPTLRRAKQHAAPGVGAGSDAPFIHWPSCDAHAWGRAAGRRWRRRWRAWPTSASGAASRRTSARRRPASWPAARRRWPRSACPASPSRSACRACRCPARARRLPGAPPGATAGAAPGATAGTALRSRSACRASPRHVRAPSVGGPLGPNRVAACRAQACTSAYAVVRGLGCLVGLVVATGWRALRQAASARAEGAGAALAAALTAKPGAAPSGADAGADGLAGLAPHFGTHAGLDAARALADKAGAAAAELGFHGLDLRALAPAEGPLRELVAAAAGAAAAAAAAPAAAAAALAGWQPDQAAAAAAAAASAFAASLQDAGAHARLPGGVQKLMPCSAAAAARQRQFHI